jgi:hypothetical protein
MIINGFGHGEGKPKDKVENEEAKKKSEGCELGEN